jgi:hypothetical protein
MVTVSISGRMRQLYLAVEMRKELNEGSSRQPFRLNRQSRNGGRKEILNQGQGLPKPLDCLDLGSLHRLPSVDCSNDHLLNLVES